MKRLIRISLLALLPLICCAQSQIGDRNFGTGLIPGPVFVNLSPSGNTPSGSFSVTSTGAGHFVGIIFIANTQPSHVYLGSQAAVEQPTCSAAWAGIITTCLWYVANSTGGQTTVSMDGTIQVAWEYEFSGTNLTSPIDTVGTCGVIYGNCNAYLTPSTYHDAVITAFFGDNLSTISGSPTSISHQSQVSDGHAGAATLTSSSTETATVTDAGGQTTGAIWAFN